MREFDPRTEIHYIIDRIISTTDKRKRVLRENILKEYENMGVHGMKARDCHHLEIRAIEEMWRFYRSVHRMNRSEFEKMIYSNRKYMDHIRKAIVDRVTRFT